MNRHDHQGEVRPATKPASGPPPPVPFISLRGELRGERRVIPPDACRLGERCLVCRWRRAGLLSPPPGTEAA